MDKAEVIHHILENPKTVTIASTATASTGAATALSWIPNDIGNLAGLIGIIVTVATFYFYRKKMVADTRLSELKIMEHEIRLDRLKKDIPTRRLSDEG